MQCRVCKNDLSQGDIVIDMARFNTIEGIFDGQWISGPSNRIYLFKSAANPNLRQYLLHKSCLLEKLQDLTFEEVGRGLPGGIF